MTTNGFLITIPHSGEKYPPEAVWMDRLDSIVALRDVDRFVDELYKPTLERLKIPYVDTPWSRYVVDLNRNDDEYDADSVENAPHPSGQYPRGLHWSITTLKERILHGPMAMATHKKLMDLCFHPFHNEVLRKTERLQKAGCSQIFHLDLHSMPSMGTSEHKDPGQRRADVVISDFHGRSASPEFLSLVVNSYAQQGFSIRVNWPYVGGGVTQRYGRPELKHHTVQVELNRSLYMDESTKEKNSYFATTQERLSLALEAVARGVQLLKT